MLGEIVVSSIQYHTVSHQFHCRHHRLSCAVPSYSSSTSPSPPRASRSTRYKLPLRGKLTPSTAALSTNQLHLSPAPSLTNAQGSPAPSSKIFFKISFLPEPVATKATLTPCVTTGKLSVMRFGGGLGESSIGATQASVSRSRACPGNKLQVWPSGPQPSRSRSKMGSLTESRLANDLTSSCSYESASSWMLSNRLTSIVCTLGVPSSAGILSSNSDFSRQ